MPNVWQSSSHVVLRQIGRPGSLYNLGNTLGLVAGLAVGTGEAIRSSPHAFVGAVLASLAGSPAAALISLATLIFFASGVAYESRTQSGQGLFWGDVLSGIGATVFSAGLAFLGNPVLAAASGLLNAGGKFGSAALAFRSPSAAAASRWSDLFRFAALASRVPAFVVTLDELIVRTALDGLAQALVMPATMLVCTLLWSCADTILLLQNHPSPVRAAPRPL